MEGRWGPSGHGVIGYWGWIFELGKWIGRGSKGIKVTDQYIIKDKKKKIYVRQWVKPWIMHMGCVLLHSGVCARLLVVSKEK